ncbi:hypothetical protein TNCV_4909471 [Trichonephila clavipes]|uniref:Uncharacterized protein n=1 Tax=Trichonephila clavipes TaxID=2585209 RepID=A0A8X6RSZ3_TRICX|nr:hypothetical protein TNCV_4909471 [Trichonephila clavipes]
MLADLEHPCILGIDFIGGSKIILDFDRKSLAIPDSQIDKHSFLKAQMALENSLVNVALYHIHHIWHYRVRLRKSGQPIGRLRKTCKNAFPRTIPVSFGRLDTPIATESRLNVHFF